MIKTIPETERPRERCLKHGPGNLSLRECIAILIGSGPKNKGCLGVALDLLSKAGVEMNAQEQENAFFTGLEVSEGAHLSGVSGLGPAAKARILAAFELSRKYAFFKESAELPQGYTKLANLALKKIPSEMRQSPTEWLGFVPLHRNGKIGDFCIVEKGTRTHVNTDTTELFARVLALRPKGFFLYHNHPSGQVQASNADLELTEIVCDLAGRLGISFLGHWIVTAKKSSKIND